MSVMAVCAAIAAGAAIAVQSSLSGFIGRRLGVVESAFLIHLTGLALAGALLVVLGSRTVASWRDVPWHAAAAGFLGVGIVAAVSYSVPRLGLATLLTVTIVAQLVLGALLDHVGWLGAAARPLDVPRIAGIGILLVGTWLVVR